MDKIFPFTEEQIFQNPPNLHHILPSKDKWLSHEKLKANLKPILDYRKKEKSNEGTELVKDRASSGDSLNTQELGALLKTGGLADLTKSNSDKTKKKAIRKNKGKKQHRRLGVARGGARLGSRVSKRDD